MAYSPAMTQRWFDIAVETVESHQRRGLAELVSRRLISLLMKRGLDPIWGAVDSNAASLALARKLGFVAHDDMALFTRPRSAGRHRRT
jgi:L-amino acid N-acyltransferase YncA